MRGSSVVSAACLLLASTASVPPPARAQQEERAPAPVALPPESPEAFLGFRPGADRRVVDWSQIVGYLGLLARQSDRVRLDTIGRSTLDRPIVLAVISDPANLERLEEIRRVQERLADPRRVEDRSEREELIRRGRLVVAITTSIHPTEVGSSLVPLTLAYRLASASDPDIDRVLREIVILLVPSVNPDGVDVVAEWYRESIDMPWEGTPPPRLYHHYAGHDLNRDWYALTQRETRVIVDRVYRIWHPHIVHDIHQQGKDGSRFFVPPWLDPIEPNVDPLIVAAANALGTAIAWDVQRGGRTGVAVHSGYDAWSPSRAYAHYHGGVRILSETAGALLATPVEISPDELQPAPGYRPGMRSWNLSAPWPGGRWTLGDIVDYMQAGALALLRFAAADREAWLENFVAIGEHAVGGWKEWPDAWIISAEQDNPAGVAELLRILRAGEIEIQYARQGLRVGDAEYPAGTYVVRMRQPYAAFAQALLEPASYPAAFEHPGGPPLAPYDATAHNLPLLLGVRATAVRGRLQGALDPLDEAPRGPPPRVPGLSDDAGVLVGLYQPWVPTPDEGWTRWLFDRYGVPYVTLHNDQVRRGGLFQRFTAVVLPSLDSQAIQNGWAEGSMPVRYAGGLGEDGAAALGDFVEKGGTLVALGSSAGYAIDRLHLPVTDRLRGQPKDRFFAPGALVRLAIDTATSVGRGMAPRASGWIEGGLAFDLPAGSRAVRVAEYGREPVVEAGWVHGTSQLAGAAAVLDVPMGRGRVVLFGIRPQYRGQSLATFPLLFNSLRRSE